MTQPCSTRLCRTLHRRQRQHPCHPHEAPVCDQAHYFWLQETYSLFHRLQRILQLTPCHRRAYGIHECLSIIEQEEEATMKQQLMIDCVNVKALLNTCVASDRGVRGIRNV